MSFNLPLLFVEYKGQVLGYRGVGLYLCSGYRGVGLYLCSGHRGVGLYLCSGHRGVGLTKQQRSLDSILLLPVGGKLPKIDTGQRIFAKEVYIMGV